MRQLHILYTHRFYEPKQLLRLCDLNVDSFNAVFTSFFYTRRDCFICFLYIWVFWKIDGPLVLLGFSLSFFLFFSCSLLCSSLLSLIIVFVSLAAFVVNVSCICFLFLFGFSLFRFSVSLCLCLYVQLQLRLIYLQNSN